MKTQPDKIARSGHKAKPSVILSRWSSAIATLHINYTHLNNWVSTHLHTTRAGNIGQCSISQAILLLNGIKLEMKNLLDDMYEPDCSGELTTDKHCQQLINHTIRLEKLNRQAKQLIQLAALPPC